MNLRELVDLMLVKRVVRVKTTLFEEDRAAPTEIELAPEAFAQAPMPGMTLTPMPAQPDRCACSHSILEEHNESGCLHGCGHEVCAPEGGME